MGRLGEDGWELDLNQAVKALGAASTARPTADLSARRNQGTGSAGDYTENAVFGNVVLQF